MQVVVVLAIIHVWLLVKDVQDNALRHAEDALVVVVVAKDVQVVVAVVVLVRVKQHVLLHVIRIVLLVVMVH